MDAKKSLILTILSASSSPEAAVPKSLAYAVFSYVAKELSPVLQGSSEGHYSVIHELSFVSISSAYCERLIITKNESMVKIAFICLFLILWKKS